MKQLVLKPHDVVVALRLALAGSSRPSMAVLGNELHLATSEVHSSIRRCQLARLVIRRESADNQVARASLLEYLTSGVRYAYPAMLGTLTSGVRTAYAAKPLADVIVQSHEMPPVWPHPLGTSRGVALTPLYPGAPAAAEKNPKLYELLALVDAIRMGTARERMLAAQMLEEHLP